VQALRRRVRDLARRVGGGLRDNPTLVLMLLVAAALSRFDLAYNHFVGAYALMGLAVFNFKLWRGRASPFDLVTPLVFLTTGLWIWWRGNADVIPYLGIVFFAAMAVACALQLVLRRPGTFRDEARVAENYLDTGLRGLVALAGAAMGLAWIPQPRYLALPFALLLAFRLALPLRRVLYPWALAVVGIAPEAGPAPASGGVAHGYTPGRAAVVAASLLLAAFLAPRLVFTRERYDLTIPPSYSLPRELLQERRAELEAYVAQAPGSVDAVALTELGFVYHDLGLTDASELVQARRVLERAMFLDPANAQAIAWYGSTLAAGAIHEGHPLRRTRLVADGLAQLDRAVRLAPDDPMVRLARASVCLGMPSFIGRLPTAREDVDRLLVLARTHPRETDPILPFVYHLAGDAHALLGEADRARTYWQAALAELPESSADYRRIAARLAGPAARVGALRLAERGQGAEARP